jgi:hypothetical protein
MKRQTCEFVSVSDVFKGCKMAWNAFANSDPDCTWGDNNRSLVTPDVIYNQLDDYSADTKEEQRQISIVKKRLTKLGQTYIDLES